MVTCAGSAVAESCLTAAAGEAGIATDVGAASVDVADAAKYDVVVVVKMVDDGGVAFGTAVVRVVAGAVTVVVVNVGADRSLVVAMVVAVFVDFAVAMVVGVTAGDGIVVVDAVIGAVAVVVAGEDVCCSKRNNMSWSLEIMSSCCCCCRLSIEIVAGVEVVATGVSVAVMVGAVAVVEVIDVGAGNVCGRVASGAVTTIAAAVVNAVAVNDATTVAAVVLTVDAIDVAAAGVV